MPAGKGGKRGARSEDGPMSTLVFNVGKKHKIKPGDILGVILGAAKVPKTAVGYIGLQPGQTTVAIAEKHAHSVVKKLNDISFKGHRLSVRQE